MQKPKKQRSTRVQNEIELEPPTTQFKFLTSKQEEYYNNIKQNIITFGIGCAGTGKSFVPIAYACEQLNKKKIKKVIFTRPAVECGEEYGFLPGELDEKIEPYYKPVKDCLYQILGNGHTDYFIKRGVIEFRPLAFMRGTTFNDAVIIVDESQNITPTAMEMLLLRIGHNCTVVINGDVKQKDIDGYSGLPDAINKIRHIRKVAITEFTIDDVVRSGICKEIIKAYS